MAPSTDTTNLIFLNNFVEHDNPLYLLLPYHEPEVWGGVGQRTLCQHVGSAHTLFLREKIIDVFHILHAQQTEYSITTKS